MIKTNANRWRRDAANRGGPPPRLNEAASRAASHRPPPRAIDDDLSDQLPGRLLREIAAEVDR